MRRSILITGASRGVGRATAVAFAARGDRVAIHHRDSEQAAQKLRLELAGEGHVVVQADLASPSAIQAMVSEAAAALGGLDVVVNNAARSGPHAITDVSYEDWQAAWRETVEVNLIGAANVIYCAVKHMRRGGRIVNVSSRGAFRGEPRQPAYGASKAGLNALGQSLAVALAPLGIAVATVAPGWVETDPSNAHLKSPRGPEILAQSPFNRIARPDEVAAAIVWLSSPEAEWASGAILDLNGASYLRS
jgi:NAD(P)-dependent dehydrogenase (short-subunit alcohol dehydrogenase family)